MHGYRYSMPPPVCWQGSNRTAKRHLLRDSTTSERHTTKRGQQRKGSRTHTLATPKCFAKRRLTSPLAQRAFSLTNTGSTLCSSILVPNPHAVAYLLLPPLPRPLLLLLLEDGDELCCVFFDLAALARLLVADGWLTPMISK